MSWLNGRLVGMGVVGLWKIGWLVCLRRHVSQVLAPASNGEQLPTAWPHVGGEFDKDARAAVRHQHTAARAALSVIRHPNSGHILLSLPPGGAKKQRGWRGLIN